MLLPGLSRTMGRHTHHVKKHFNSTWISIESSLRYSSSSNHNDKLTIENAVDTLRTNLELAGVSEAQESAEYIVAHVLDKKTLYETNLDAVLNQNEWHFAQSLCDKRRTNCPIQYVIGEWDFWNFTLKTKQPVFIPRPETEQLVELAISHLKKSPKLPSRFLEIGTGTGAISITLLKEFPEIRGVAIEKSNDAFDLTWLNAKEQQVQDRLRLILKEFTSDVAVKLSQSNRFDFMISNPPYITSADMENLQTEITRFEDHGALHGGDDGLDVIKHILDTSHLLLIQNGHIWLEVDSTHPPIIEHYLEENKNLGLKYVATHLDFRKMTRFCHIMKV